MLASASPRRREMLSSLGIDLTIVTADIEESRGPDEDPASFVCRMAREKAAAVSGIYPDAWIVAADTVVCLGNSVMGKPENCAAAAEMLAGLSGRWHEVLTGFCLSCGAKDVSIVRWVKTDVKFMELDSALIASYVDSGEPLDKAGAYGIQGLGGAFVEKIRGSYSSVVGLPVAELVSDMLRHGVIAPAGI